MAALLLSVVVGMAGPALAEEDENRFAKDFGYGVGAFFTNLIAYFIIVCCGATLYQAGIHQLDDAGQAAQALAPLAGKLATVLFALGLFNASCFGAITVPLSTAYAVTESLGWESGIGRRSREAPLFIGADLSKLDPLTMATLSVRPLSLIAWLLILKCNNRRPPPRCGRLSWRLPADRASTRHRPPAQS